MGTALSRIANFINTEVGLYRERIKPVFERADDFDPAGRLRPHIREYQLESYKYMLRHDFVSRDLLLPIINKRLKLFFASQKYTQSNIDELLDKFPNWDIFRIFDYHDTFRIFEVDGDGLIETAEMNTALDNLGDPTPLDQRRTIIEWNDVDGTGNLDFEEFLKICYDLEWTYPEHTLGKTLRMIDKTNRKIRLMSTPQQIRSGFF